MSNTLDILEVSYASGLPEVGMYGVSNEQHLLIVQRALVLGAIATNLLKGYQFRDHGQLEVIVGSNIDLHHGGGSYISVLERTIQAEAALKYEDEYNPVYYGSMGAAEAQERIAAELQYETDYLAARNMPDQS